MVSYESVVAARIRPAGKHKPANFAIFWTNAFVILVVLETLRMKSTASQLFRLLFFLCLTHGSLAQTIQNPIGPPTGRYPSVYDRQFLGARFALDTPVTLGSVGGEFGTPVFSGGGSFFVALVPLASMTSLPTGNPAAGIPFNPGEVLAYRTFEARIGTTPQIITVPFSIDLSPGVYGVVFGSGLLGTYGADAMPSHQTVAGSSSFFWSSEPWRWQNSSLNHEYNIMITIVPEPSCPVLMTLGLSGLTLLRRVRRVHC